MTSHAPQAPGTVHPRIVQRRNDVSAAVARTTERRRRRLLWMILLLLLAGVGSYLAIRSELLDVDEITVEGGRQTASPDVLAAAGISRGDPLVGLELAAARTRIAELPWVLEVYSERSWRGAVSFRITERVPVAAVAVPGAWATVDAAGRVLETGPQFPPGVMPVVGLDVAAVAAGDWLPRRQLAALQLAAALREPVRSAIRGVVVGPEGLYLDLHLPGYVQLGDARDLGAKLLAVRTFLEKVNLLCLERLDVRSAGTPVLTRRSECL